jgi:hypothetical protein
MTGPEGPVPNDPSYQGHAFVKIAASLAMRLAGPAALAALVLGLFAPVAQGFGFGEPVVSSALGQPLRMRIPLREDPELELTPQCVRLLGSSGADAIPTITMAMARISIERKGDARVLRIDSLYPMNEPVLRVQVEAGCAQHARREFMLLLDPPDALPQLALSAPLADAPAAPAPVAPAPPASAALPAGAGAPATGSAPGADGATTGVQAPAQEVETPAAQIVLGGATIAGRVGEALAMQIPVTGSGAATLDPGCVHLAGNWNGEGAPVLSQASINLVRNGADTLIDLRTANPVTEPALRVIVEAGCGTAARREYAVLLDRPAAETLAANAPAAASAAAPLPAAAATPPDAAAAAPAAGNADNATAAAPKVTKPPRKIFHRPLAPSTLATAPEQAAPAKAAAPVAAPAAAAAAPSATPPKPRAAAPGGDHLVLAAPADQPDPAAVRLAEMDKRIADLTREITQLRGELVAERQRAAEAAQERDHLGTGWIVAILALLGLGVGGLMSWQRKRSGMPWEKASWEPAATTLPDAPRPAAPAPAAATVPAREAQRTPGAAAPAPAANPVAPAPYRPAPRGVAPPPPRPGAPPPSPAALANFEELTGSSSTLTPGAGGPKTTIEVTELHVDDSDLQKMHTVFLEPGNLDGPVFTSARPSAAPPVAMDTRIPGPRPEPGGGAPGEMTGRATSAAAPVTQLPPLTDLPPMPPPTIVAPEQRHGAFSFDEGPYTQTPTMLVLDLDLTTRALPVEDAEAARMAPAVPNGDGKPAGGKGGDQGGNKSGKAAGEAAPSGAAGSNGSGYKNGH